MSFLTDVSWTPAIKALIAFAAAVIIALLAHKVLYILLRRIARRSTSSPGNALVRNTSGATRLLFLVIAISFVLPGVTLPPWADPIVHHVLEISFIAGLAWLAIGSIRVVEVIIIYRLPVNEHDNLRARRLHTQVRLLGQIAIGTAAFVGLAAALMTFPSVRSVGAGLFASAGLAGLALGMAARPALANVIAGIQIALTEPIRLDDVVIVEGEWGRIEEVNTTYVVVRLWDLRRMVVPLSYFIEKPFQNWTRTSADLLGTVLLRADYTVPIDEIRQEFGRVLKSAPQWDGKVSVVQVTDASDQSIEIRFLMSAADSGQQFDLRCYVREKMIGYLQQHYPHALPRIRADVSPLPVRNTANDPMALAGRSVDRRA